MELKQGEYMIASDCRAIVAGGKVYVFDRLIKGRKQGDKKHCKDCKHRVFGRACLGTTHKTYVCELRPKATYRNANLFYAVSMYHEICKHFKLKESYGNTSK